MQVYSSEKDCLLTYNNSIICIGNFDGLHLGHQQYLKYLTSKKKDQNPLGVFTFTPNPKEILNKEEEFFYLTNDKEKIDLISKYQIDFVYLQKVDDKFLSLTAAQFFEQVVISKFRAREIVVGDDFRFGFKAQGNIDTLALFCKEYGVQLTVLPTYKVGDKRCSSSAIRSYLIKGDVKKANTMLGRFFSLKGIVVKGDGQGEKIGFKTANIKLPSYNKMRHGVYQTVTRIDKNIYKSISNIGLGKTVKLNNKQPLIETHIFDFHENIYDKEIEISFLNFIRNEIKFSSREKLILRIKKDISIIS